MTDLRIEGAEQLDALARRLKAAGDGGLRRELLAGIRRAAAPLPSAARASALTTLPTAGGLAGRVAASRMAIRTRLTGANLGVRVEAKSLWGLRAMDAGTVRHPVFGRGAWVTQPIADGWFSAAMKERAGDVQMEVRDAMERVARQVTKEGP